jgi:hypothetical protein
MRRGCMPLPPFYLVEQVGQLVKEPRFPRELEPAPPPTS